MLIYADARSKRLTQIALDIAFVLWIVLSIWLGNTVHDKTMELAEPAKKTETSATSLGESMGDAGDILGDVPLIGDGVSQPFEKAAKASNDIADAGARSAEAVESLALWLGLAIAGIPILVVATRYLPGRIRFVREARASRSLLNQRADLELFAMRAMAHRPLHQLARITPDPVGAVRRQEWPTLYALASLELAQHGLSLPRVPPTSPRPASPTGPPHGRPPMPPPPGVPGR